jgi:uncharacterized protein (TIRG00374 family)
VLDALLAEAGGTTASTRNRILWLLSVALAALFLYLALREVDWPQFISILRGANWLLALPIFLWHSLTELMRAVRLRLLVIEDKPVPLLQVFWANESGYLVNTLFPGRLGEFARALYLGREARISATFVFAAGLAEQIADATALVSLGLVSLAAVGLVSPRLRDGLRLMAAVIAAALVFLILTPRLTRQFDWLVARLPRLSEPNKQRLSGFVHQFLRGLGSLLHVRRAILFALLTVLVWVMDGLAIVFVARALGMPLTLIQSWLLISALALASAVPATPGYVGIYQFVAVVVMAPLGYPASSAVALVLAVQAMIWTVALFWGGIAVARLSRILGSQQPEPAVDPP